MHIHKHTQGGYALITSLIFFLAASTAVLAGLSDGILREVRVIKNESSSRQSYFTSESALEDSIYRVKNNKQIGTTETLSVGNSTASVSITTGGDGTKTVASSADTASTARTVQATLNTGTATAFNYALQTGVGGIDLQGNIEGDVYTTGSIRGCGYCQISGMAVAAGQSTFNLDTDNATPTVPTQSITFGNANASQDLAQSFTVSQALSITELRMYIKKVGNPSNATIKIMNNNGSIPGSTILASGTLSSSLVTTSYAWMSIDLTANPILTAGTTYWLVIDANTNSSSYYVVGANSSYANGQAKVGRLNNNSWNATSPSGLDMYVKIYIGTNEDGIVGTDQYNKMSVGSVYAYNASFLNVSGSLYCQTGTLNNKACDTSRGNPSVEAYPVPDSMIVGWQNEALAGGVSTGNYAVGYAGATLGPKKIVGNLTVSGGGTLRVSGTLWVTGTVTINGGAKVTSSDGTRSFVIMSDTTMSLSGGAEITGNNSSHIMLLSTSVADPAITIDGGANDTVLFAPNGGITVSGGAKAKAAAAKHLTITGGAEVEYDPDMAQLNFSGGTSGVPMSIKSWKETE